MKWQRVESKSKFKSLQGLRAIAVVIVIAFHYGIPIHGGFLGVDLFFLISGFIIPWTLLRERDEHGRINLKSFYQRRIHRLFPASIFTITITLIIAWLISTPEISLITAKSSLAGLLISANYLIASLGNNYFSPAAELNPLLHYWSLSVEEQVYLFVAILIGVLQLRRLGSAPSRWIGKFLLLLATSISLLFWLLPRSESTDGSIFLNYYSTIIRLWEFTLGFILLLLFRKFGPRKGSFKGLADVAVIAICGLMFLTTFGNTNQTNLRTLIFLIAASYFIYPSSEHMWSQRFLASRVMQYLGDRSYSLYLIHWPLFVYLKSLGFVGKRLVLLAIVATMILSVMNYKFVESKFRLMTKKNFIVIVVSLTLALSLSVTSLLVFNQRVDSYRNELASNEKYAGEIGHPAFFEYLYSNMNQCLPESIREGATNEGYLRCWQSKVSAKQDLVLFGDSHSEHLFPGFAAGLPDLNVVYFDALGSPTNGSPQAMKIIKYIVGNTDIKYVVLSTYWSNRGIDIPKLRQLVDQLHSAGKFVFLASDIPGFQGDPFNCKYGINPSRFGIKPCASSFDNQPQITESNITQLSRVISGIPQTKILNTTSPFCNADLTQCSMVHGGKILYRDPNHLNATGSIYLVESLLQSGQLPPLR